MKKLPPPNVDFQTALAEAISGIGSAHDRIPYQAAFVDPASIEADYVHSAETATLYSKSRIVDSKIDPLIYGGLRKSHFVKLYNQYFVPEGKPARRLYEAIKVTANGKCPLCGGVGHVRTLDHYLPKANFPLYSIMPANLVPCCRDCNSEKLNAFATVRERQSLHPYFDHNRFFEDKWIHAKVIRTAPPVIEFFVSPPIDWAEDDKSRVSAHFSDYDLAKKFSVEAAADLPETIQTRRTIMSANGPQAFSFYLAEKSHTTTLPVNNWRRVMFAALAADQWFCNQTFMDT